MVAYNLLLVGDAACGKSTFINRHVTSEFRKHYIHDEEPVVSTLDFMTNRGVVIVRVTEMNENGPLPDTIDGIMVMYDVTSKASFELSLKTINHLGERYQKPMVWLGNKVDIKHKHHVQRSPSWFYYPISAKSNYNYEKPFLYLIRSILRDADLEFVSWPDITPPEVVMTEEVRMQWDRDQEEALRSEVALSI